MTPNNIEFYKNLLEHMSDGVYFVDRDRRIQFWNKGADRLTGYKAGEVIGRFCQDDLLCHVDDRGTRLCQDGCPLSASMADGQSHEASVFLRHKQGRRVPVLVRVEPIREADGTIAGAVEIFSDNSALYLSQRKTRAMEKLAFLDALTQIPNRRFLEMSLGTAMIEYHVHHDPFGVLLFDLNGFKIINDTFGHASGDMALQEVAKTLLEALRPTDIVGRWGGDEFLVIAKNVDMNTLQAIADRCVLLVKQTWLKNPDGRRISISISVGSSVVRPDDTVDQLFYRADQRMYEYKSSRSASDITKLR